MPIREYFDEIRHLIANTPFILSISLHLEERPPFAGLIKGKITFVDNTELHFKEFLIAKKGIQVIKYSYHYISANSLFFRYDNALDPAAKKLETFPHHKHMGDKLLNSKQPALSEVLHEIALKIKEKGLGLNS
ncbi:MAG TPA: DUF6516 family protein [Candidatus Brocadiales bacterium]|nr:DUF6516 family protein [Candidatus Brocadiales bacterium]